MKAVLMIIGDVDSDKLILVVCHDRLEATTIMPLTCDRYGIFNVFVTIHDITLPYEIPTTIL